MLSRTILRWKSNGHPYRILAVESNGYEQYFLKNNKSDKVESFWKSFPPTSNDYVTVNGIIEVPYSSLAKMELKKDIKDHPHAQDFRRLNGTLVPRYYQMATLFNYGYIPQTWDSNHIGTFYQHGLTGDLDPIDIVELSNRPVLTRLPTEMVVIGALGLIDQGELDWKILTLDLEEAKRLEVHSLTEALQRIPERLNYVRDFFRIYKTLEGKPENKYLEEARYYTQD